MFLIGKPKTPDLIQILAFYSISACIFINERSCKDLNTMGHIVYTIHYTKFNNKIKKKNKVRRYKT